MLRSKETKALLLVAAVAIGLPRAFISVPKKAEFRAWWAKGLKPQTLNIPKPFCVKVLGARLAKTAQD